MSEDQTSQNQSTDLAPCDWHEDGEGTWHTSCEGSFTLNDGTPKENGMRFCCYCGKPLAEWHMLAAADIGDQDAEE